MKNNFVRIVLLFFSAIWIIGFTQLILFPNSNIGLLFHPLMKKFYSTVCHQDPDKLCYINGASTYLCARCAGIYLGLFTGIIISFFYRKTIKLKFLVIFGGILLIDVIISTIGLYNYTKTVAFITGLFFGIPLFLYIQDVIFILLKKKGPS